jgi:hypothetical protein
MSEREKEKMTTIDPQTLGVIAWILRGRLAQDPRTRVAFDGLHVRLRAARLLVLLKYAVGEISVYHLRALIPTPWGKRSGRPSASQLEALVEHLEGALESRALPAGLRERALSRVRALEPRVERRKDLTPKDGVRAA